MPPKFCPNCATPWVGNAKFCTECGKPPTSITPQIKNKVNRFLDDDTDDETIVSSDNKAWLESAIRAGKIAVGNKKSFAMEMNQGVAQEKERERVRAEVKREREKKVQRDAYDKKEREEGVQSAFGQDPRNEAAHSIWRELEIYLIEEGVSAYKLLNSTHLHKFELVEKLPNINNFVRKHVQRHDKWTSRQGLLKELVEDNDIKAYIALPGVNNQTPCEVRFECDLRTTIFEFLTEFDSIKPGKHLSRLVLCFPVKRLEIERPSRSQKRTLSLSVPLTTRNKRSKSRESEGEDERAIKTEPKIKTKIKAEPKVKVEPVVKRGLGRVAPLEDSDDNFPDIRDIRPRAVDQHDDSSSVLSDLDEEMRVESDKEPVKETPGDTEYRMQTRARKRAGNN
jgi:hypothetical protein